MPSLDNVPVREYQPNDPYTSVVDNGPIQDLETQILLINAQVDADRQTLTDAQGTTGSVANRLNQSLNPDGTLITAAIDTALHSVEQHTDSPNYVRMQVEERAKLAGIASGATNFILDVTTTSGTTSYNSGPITLQPSDTITWRTSTTNIYADVAFPVSAIHQHYYDQVPVAQNLLSPDYQHYYTTSVPTAYMAGSLRVFVNGTRLSKNASVSFPRGGSWIANGYTEDTAVSGVVTSGKFTLTSAILSSDIIVIDFDFAIN